MPPRREFIASRDGVDLTWCSTSHPCSEIRRVGATACRPPPSGDANNSVVGTPASVEVAELAREHGPRAIEVLVQLMNNEKAPASVRAAAAEKILDRGF